MVSYEEKSTQIEARGRPKAALSAFISIAKDGIRVVIFLALFIRTVGLPFALFFRTLAFLLHRLALQFTSVSLFCFVDFDLPCNSRPRFSLFFFIDFDLPCNSRPRKFVPAEIAETQKQRARTRIELMERFMIVLRRI